MIGESVFSSSCRLQSIQENLPLHREGKLQRNVRNTTDESLCRMQRKCLIRTHDLRTGVAHRSRARMPLIPLPS